jgi:hypothetical protein
MDKLVCIKVFGSRMEAEMAQGVLAAQGIEARVLSDDAGGVYPAILLGTGGARLMVNQAAVDEAMELLEALDAGSSNGDESDPSVD